MKFWLIIFLIDPNLPRDENFVGKIEIPYASKAACEAVLKAKNYNIDLYSGSEKLIVDPNFAPDCYSDNHVKGIKPDPGKRFD